MLLRCAEVFPDEQFVSALSRQFLGLADTFSEKDLEAAILRELERLYLSPASRTADSRAPPGWVVRFTPTAPHHQAIDSSSVFGSHDAALKVPFVSSRFPLYVALGSPSLGRRCSLNRWLDSWWPDHEAGRGAGRSIVPGTIE